MTKKEFTQKVRALGITNKIFFEIVGKSQNALAAVKAEQELPESYTKLLNLFQDKLDKEMLLKEIDKIKNNLENLQDKINKTSNK